jgi:CRISPR-associated protein Csm2
MAILEKLTYVKQAESVMKKLTSNPKYGLTTSKIRNILSMISEIYNDVVLEIGEKISVDLQERVQYIKMRIAYEAGRERAVKEFVQEAKIFDCIDDIKDSREKLIMFCNYMESLVAYHKYLSEKD